jgi:CRISPR-associated protein Csm3
MSGLLGKVIIKGTIEVKTGMRIGGTTTGLKIGGVDLNVITDPEGKPYVPGSSLKGKMRSLIERKEQVKFNDKGVHLCSSDEDYKKCIVCKIWGTLGNKDMTCEMLTKLIVRDTLLDETSITDGMRKNLELQWTEVKFETAIDRVKGTALHGSLRQAERVPAGARFSPMEMIYNVYEESDKDILVKVFEALELLEHDYLGGMGSRGYGQVEFKGIKVYWNTTQDYESGKLNQKLINDNLDTPSKIVEKFSDIKKEIK